MNQPKKYGLLNEEALATINAIREALVSSSLLALSNCTVHSMPDTDTYDKQVGCVSLQEETDETTRHIGYWLRSLNNAENIYDTIQRECLVILWSVLILCPYLKRIAFINRTDHNSLTSILDLTGSTGWLAQQRLRLLEHDYDVDHRAGTNHQVVDALSRLRTTGEERMLLDDDSPVLSIDKQENFEQSVHVINTYDNKKITLWLTEEQPVDVPPRQKN